MTINQSQNHIQKHKNLEWIFPVVIKAHLQIVLETYLKIFLRSQNHKKCINILLLNLVKELNNLISNHKFFKEWLIEKILQVRLLSKELIHHYFYQISGLRMTVHKKRVWLMWML